MKKFKNAKVHTLLTALDVVRKYCAYQERSQMEVRNKFYELKLDSKEVEQAISVLIEENFLNEERFSVAYARGKFRIKRWGKIKIIQGLKLRNISPYCINKAINTIDDDEYNSVLNTLISRSFEATKEQDMNKRKFIVAKKIAAKGFESDLVWDHINRLS